MKHLVIVLITVCFVHLSFSQTMQGLVSDLETNEPLEFASIGVKGKSTGTISNIEGRFVLNLHGLETSDVVIFSYMGYGAKEIPLSELVKADPLVVALEPAVLNLSEVSIYSGEITVGYLLEQVRSRFAQNHPQPTGKQRIFLHKYEETPFKDHNQVTVKKSNFEGLDKQTADEFLSMLPEKFVEYQDLLVDVYSTAETRKVVPIEAVSLEENSQKDLMKEMENKMGDFFKDIEATNQEEGVYYKFRSGIFAFKMDDGEVHRDTVEQEGMNDSLNFIASRGMVAGRLDHLVNEYANINSENWEFINKERKYRYELGEATVYLDELVYPIRFTPKGGGLFEGTMYISATNYAVIQLDFAYAKGKSNENIQLLGIGHSMKNKEGHVIFERGDDGYYVKYIYASQREVGSIDRSLSIMKKQKRFLWDKELNEIKMDISLKFDTEAFYELLVLERSDVSQEEVNKIEEPKSIQFRKEYSYSADMWNDRTVIAPTTELRKYQRAD